MHWPGLDTRYRRRPTPRGACLIRPGGYNRSETVIKCRSSIRPRVRVRPPSPDAAQRRQGEREGRNSAPVAVPAGPFDRRHYGSTAL